MLIGSHLCEIPISHPPAQASDPVKPVRPISFPARCRTTRSTTIGRHRARSRTAAGARFPSRNRSRGNPIDAGARFPSRTHSGGNPFPRMTVSQDGNPAAVGVRRDSRTSGPVAADRGGVRGVGVPDGPKRWRNQRLPTPLLLVLAD